MNEDYPHLISRYVLRPLMEAHGTPAQQEVFLPRLAVGVVTCQLFSEPSAGSDLASVRTTAEAAPGGWTLTGDKVWSSRAAYAELGLCLARHEEVDALSLFIVEMGQPGVEVRPLVQMNGDQEFSSVRLTGAWTGQLLGEAGAGWPLAKEALGLERRIPPEASKWIWSPVVPNDSLHRDRAMSVLVQDRVRRLADQRDAAGEVWRGSMRKLRLASAFKARTSLALDAEGASGMLDGPATGDFLTSPSVSIRGGTDEIQREVLAEQALGLPSNRRHHG